MFIYLCRRVRFGAEVIPLLFLFFSLSPYWASLCISAVAIHELSHLSYALLSGRKTDMITLTLIGADIRFSREEDYLTEAFTAFSGILGGAVSGGLFIAASGITGVSYLYSLGTVSVMYAALNIFPVKMLDGGRTLSFLLSLFFGPEIEGKVMTAVSVITLIFLWLVGVSVLFYTSFNATLLLMSSYLFFTLLSKSP